MKAPVMKPEEVLQSTPHVLNLKKILVPTDFSPASRKSLSYALRFAGGPNSEITLLHVLEPEIPLALPGRPATAAFSEEELAAAIFSGDCSLLT